MGAVVALDAKPKRRSTKVGPLDASALRKAFIMKELLDKPLALRNRQDELLS